MTTTPNTIGSQITIEFIEEELSTQSQLSTVPSTAIILEEENT
jgi:hypothetical protein